MSGSAITYAPCPDASPEAEISVLASIYKLAINSHARKEATRPGSPDDPERRSDEIRAKTRIP